MKLFFAIFPALRERNLVILFIGLFVSFCGSWLQIGTQAWLVNLMTHSAQEVGIVAALNLAPTFILAIFGGVLVDRFNKKKVLLLTQTGAMIQAFLFAYLVYSGNATVNRVRFLALMLGFINALDGPARHSLIIGIAKNIRSAVAIQTSIVVTAQAIGGALTGLLIPTFGISGSFLLNGLSFIPLFYCLKTMKASEKREPIVEHPFRSALEGWKYLCQKETMLAQIILAGMIAALGFSYRAILPVVAIEQFGAGAGGYGALFAATSVGSIIASFFTSGYSEKLESSTMHSYIFVFGGLGLLGMSLFCFQQTHWLHLGLFYCMTAGIGNVLASGATRGAVFSSIDNENMKGRIVGFFQTFFIGGSTLGNYFAGMIAEYFGQNFTIGLIGFSALLVCGVTFALRHSVIKTIQPTRSAA